MTDQSNAFMPGVRVRAVNAATQVTASTTTNATGNFVIPFLTPGTYSLTAEMTGFKKFSRSGIQLRVSEVAEINIPMALGTVEETVSVVSDAPLLDTAAASLGQVVDQRRIQELPLFAGNPLELMFITPGIVNPTATMPQQHAPWNGLQVQSNGNAGASNDFSIDGVPNTYPNGISRGVRPAFSPPTTAVSEFRIETSSYDASVGHSIGASVNVSTRGGTNQFHGGAHWFLKNSAFDAPSFFDNQAGRKLDVYQYNRAGFDLGGPVRLPGYNGKNKTFFFYTYERNIWAVPEPRTDTVPSLRQRNGDFSGLLALGDRYQIYNPFSAAPAPGGRLTRTPFPNNVIPASLMDPVGKNMVSFYPEPNLPGTRDGLLNYYTPAVATQDYWVHLARVDHAFDENNRFFVRVDFASWDEDQLRRLGRNNPASGLLTSSRDKGAALDYVRVLSPTMVFNFRYGLTYQERADYRASQGWDLAALGFSPRLVSVIDRKFATIPEAALDGYARMSRFWTGDGSNTGLVHSLNGNFTKVLRQHNLKFGTSFRGSRSFGNRFPYATSPFFRFSTTYTRGPLDNSAGSPLGQDLASMFLGLPTDASYMELTPSFALNGPSLGLYLQDDYKLTRRLTVNLGLRWEYDLPVTERYNRLVAQFAGGTPNPIDAAAKANYARNPISEIAPADFRVLGGLGWVSQTGSGRSPFTTGGTNFMPRLGLAYQLTPKTVLRAGYGLFFDTVGVNQTVPIQTGFAQTTPIQVTRDGGLTFVTRASDPFPGGLLQPLGPAGGLKTNLNQSLNYYNSMRKNPYAQRWSFGVQQLLPAQFLVEAGYVGNRGTRLEIPRNINGVPTRYLSTSFFRDQPAIDYLSQRVPSPFLGTDPIFGSTVARVDLLRPYPHFGNVIVDENIGYSWYHSLQLRAEKRFSHGFTFQGAYTFSKLMQATEFPNAADPMPYETLAGSDRPHIVSLTGIWELPFGRGRRFGTGMPKALNAVAGGWQFGVVFRHQSGQPLEFGDAIFVGDIKNIALAKSQRTPERWFNVDAGFNRNSAQQRSHNVRTFPLRFAHVRSDAQRRWDLSVQKDFPITEAVKMAFRAEAINAPNSPIFGAPNTTPTSSSFGRVSSLAWSGRQWQFSLKLRF
ncbi:MAG: TonB-dependent receptor [Candidatus Solibacter usitatus]|nr:TonB-dependent receptor [Candidatus Solibacter usitatus]